MQMKKETQANRHKKREKDFKINKEERVSKEYQEFITVVFITQKIKNLKKRGS